MPTRCSRILHSSEHTCAAELRKIMFETKLDLVGLGGDERVPVRASADVRQRALSVMLSRRSRCAGCRSAAKGNVARTQFGLSIYEARY